MENFDFLSIGEFAEKVEVDRTTVYRWVISSKIKSHKMGREYCIPKTELSKVSQRRLIKTQNKLQKEDLTTENEMQHVMHGDQQVLQNMQHVSTEMQNVVRDHATQNTSSDIQIIQSGVLERITEVLEGFALMQQELQKNDKTDRLINEIGNAREEIKGLADLQRENLKVQKSIERQLNFIGGKLVSIEKQGNGNGREPRSNSSSLLDDDKEEWIRGKSASKTVELFRHMENVRVALKKAVVKLTITVVAKEIGVARSSLDHFVKGRTKYLKEENLKKIEIWLKKGKQG